MIGLFKGDVDYMILIYITCIT